MNYLCQVALEWLFEHADEPDDMVVSDEDVVMADVLAASKNQSNNASTEGSLIETALPPP